RLSAWYLHTADAAARLLYDNMLRLPLPPPEPSPAAPLAFAHQSAASAWLDAERPNLVAAVEHGPRPAAWQLADVLRGYFWLRLHTADWLAVARAGLAAAEAHHDLRGQAAAELSLADALQCQADYPAAIAHYERAMATARQAGWD